jgi:hypothetical protein
MAWAGQNQEVWNAAFNGALAGMFALAQPTDPTATDYAKYTAAAKAWAVAVDAQILSNAAISTGANGTTVVASAGVNAATQQAYVSLVTALSFGYWSQRSNSVVLSSDAGVTSTDYTVPATALGAMVTAAQTVFTAQSSLT